MSAKIEKISDKIGTFGGIFQTIDCFRNLGLDKLVDNTLKNRHRNATYMPSDLVENLLSVYCTGGSCIEDANIFRSDAFGRNSECRFASTDTVRHLLCENAEENTAVVSESGQLKKGGKCDVLSQNYWKCYYFAE